MRLGKLINSVAVSGHLLVKRRQSPPKVLADGCEGCYPQIMWGFLRAFAGMTKLQRRFSSRNNGT